MSYSVWSTTKSPFRCGAITSAGMRVPGPRCRAGRCRSLARRRDVIPLTAELVVGDDDHRVLRALAVLDRLEQVHEVVAAVGLAGVARMLVLLADRLDEADRLQVAVSTSCRELMNSSSSAGARHDSPARPASASRIRVVVERLVVVLEQVVRAPRPLGDTAGRRSGRSSRSASRRGVPFVQPGRRRRRSRSTSRPNTRPSRRPCRQPVADRRARLRRELGAEEPEGWKTAASCSRRSRRRRAGVRRRQTARPASARR